MRGFTILETIIYIALLGAVLTSMIVAIYPLFSGAAHTSARVIDEGEAAFVLRKLNWALADAVSVSVPNSGTLVVSRTWGGSQTFTLDDGAIEINGVPITNGRVEVRNFMVIHTPPVGELPRIIQVDFDLGGVHVGPWKKILHF